jgi:hypothetical protein
MKSICKSDFFDNKTFEKISNFVFEKINDPGIVTYAENFKKYYGIVSLPNELKEILLDKAQKETKNDSLEIIYAQIVKYQAKDGAVPELLKHKDKESLGEWVMDIVIDSTIDWPLFIEDKSFQNLPNSVFFIKGGEDWHWRPEFPSKDESDYVILLFVHLANKDSEYARVSRKIFSMEEKALGSFLKAAKPAWGQHNER